MPNRKTTAKKDSLAQTMAASKIAAKRDCNKAATPPNKARAATATSDGAQEGEPKRRLRFRNWNNNGQGGNSRQESGNRNNESGNGGQEGNPVGARIKQPLSWKKSSPIRH